MLQTAELEARAELGQNSTLPGAFLLHARVLLCTEGIRTGYLTPSIQSGESQWPTAQTCEELRIREEIFGFYIRKYF
jgi:hypothetical protein